MTTRRLLSLAAGLGLALAAAAPASADCDMAGPVDEELARVPVAFVGQATGVNGSIATFGVAEVWKGDVPPTVQVHGAFGDGSVGEDDRIWELGATYLVLPYLEGGRLRDTICSATTTWSDELAEVRPADARLVSDGDARPSAPALPMILIGVVGAAVVAFSWLAFRRRDA